jgi:micrococcal nuclease
MTHDAVSNFFNGDEAMKKLLSALVLLVFLGTSASAHPGRLDSNGGHHNRATGEYHYHRGPNAGQSRSPASSTKTPASATKTTPAEKPAPITLQPNTIYYVRVLRVVDGDTLEVAFNEATKEHVRLIGVDTPETVHPSKPVQFYGKEASNFTKENLTDKKVWLQTDVQARDRYQRVLGYVWTEKPENVDNKAEIRAKMFNARLLLDGFGQTMTIQPNSRYANLFVTLQREAREEKKGLWGE